MVNLPKWLGGKETPASPIELPTVQPDKVSRIQMMVRNFIKNNEYDWDVKALSFSYQTLPERDGLYLVITVFTPNPEKIIGVRGIIAHSLSAYVAERIGELVYTKAVYYDPFKCPFPC
jgi:hypothetical protein